VTRLLPECFRCGAAALLAIALLTAAPPARPAPAPPAAAGPAPAAPRGEARSYSTRREAEPPRYTRPLGGGTVATDDWLDAGLEYRLRSEVRANDFRRPDDRTDTPLLLRGRAFLAVRNRFDPLRFTVEIQDSRQASSDYPDDTRDTNPLEPIQAYGELWFGDGLGAGRPLSLRAGRFAFEVLDRRLIARNEWRNTTNTFQGLRAVLGDARSDWQLDLLAVRPIDRDVSGLDEADPDRSLWGALGEWRRWATVATLAPYWLRLDQAADPAAGRGRRRIHTIGARAFGPAGTTGFDYDLNAAWQTGNDGPANHRSFFGVAELGYTWDVAWRPRLSGLYLQAGGDAEPADNRSGRFERLFGFARPLSASDYFQLENLRAPKLRLELAPARWLRVDAGWSGYRLDSATDRWNNAGLRDPTGASGRDIGQELDARARLSHGRAQLTVGFAHFEPGDFTVATSGRSDPSRFLYLELYLNGLR
jgi:hypothetical protein